MAVSNNLSATGRQYQYVPTLKTKTGEIKALKSLSVGKQRVVPIFQLMPQISATFAADLFLSWQGLPVIADGVAETAATLSALNFHNFVVSLGSAGLPVTPLLDADAMPAYNSAARAFVGVYAPGSVLRVRAADLAKATTIAAANSLVALETDLVIDCGHIADIDTSLLALAIKAALNSVPGLFSTWRSATLSSSAAPKDASGLKQGPNMVPRRDWQLWQLIRASFPKLNFGDYGIAHRDLTEPPGFAMANATVSPRYALDTDWLIRKGRSTRGPNGIKMGMQYHSHAQALSIHASFGGITGCWSDNEISAIAARLGIGPSGARSTWVVIGLNRHISLVVDRLP